MWILLALLSALGAACTTAGLKRTVGYGGSLVSTVAFRIAAGLLLATLVFATGGWPTLTPTYWTWAGLVLVPETLGTIALTVALRKGDLSLVHPILGLLPLFVTVGGALVLQELPTPAALAGILLVTAGIYTVGLQRGHSLLEPLRALAREPASRYAVVAALAWTLTTVIHKFGIAEVGPFPWGATLALGSGLALAVVLPFFAHGEAHTRRYGLPHRMRRWGWLVLLTGGFFALQQVGLHLALGRAQAGYVIAINSTSILFATLLGILLLGERAAARNRLLGGLLVTAGAALVALFG